MKSLAVCRDIVNNILGVHKDCEIIFKDCKLKFTFTEKASIVDLYQLDKKISTLTLSKNPSFKESTREYIDLINFYNLLYKIL